ncbi:MAG: DUF4296 domain-containing protein [Phycisphaerae bacterium]|nr:DUF4296 domain-containing protein [Saprospiraceae bacterium]
MKLDIGYWILDVGHWTLDIGRRTLDIGYRTGHWAIIAMLGFCCSCQSNAPDQPSIPDEKIARIMADISIADAATTGLSGYVKDSLMQTYFKQVFEMHGVTIETYEKDLRIIAKDLSRMEGIVKQADALLTEGGVDPENGPYK